MPGKQFGIQVSEKHGIFVLKMASKLTYKAKANPQDIVRYIRSHYTSQDQRRPTHVRITGSSEADQKQILDFDIGPSVEARWVFNQV